MKVLFLYIDVQSSAGYSVGLGIASISGYLREKGVRSELVYFKSEKDLKYACEKISRFQPDIIGFYCTSSGWPHARRLSGILKKRHPETYQIIGGIHTTLMPESLEETDSLDAVCVGYGEEAMLALCHNLRRDVSPAEIPGLWVREPGNKSAIVKAPAHFPKISPDKLITFDHSLFFKELERYPDFKKEPYPLQVIFNRGCPFRCTFCSNHRLNQILGHRLFIPSPEACIDAINRGLQETGSQCIEIHDDILTLNKTWFHRFIRQYAKEIGIPFMCNLRIGTFDEEDIRLLKKANVLLAWVGIESGNDHIRNTVMKKGISRDEIQKGFDLLHQYDVPIATQNIIGVPQETPGLFLDTIKINADLNPTKSFLSIFHPYPGTELYDVCHAENLIGEQTKAIIERTDSVLRLPDFPPEKIRFYFKNFDTLIRYEQKRRKMPDDYPLPLTDINSVKILDLMNQEDMPLSKRENSC